MEPDGPVAVGHIVAIQVRRALIGGDQQIHVAVAVEIAVSRAAGDLGRGESRARLGRDIVEPAVAVVQKQVRRLRVTDLAANVAHGLVDVPVDREQVEPSVQIDIEEQAAEAQAVARSLARRRLASATSV